MASYYLEILFLSLIQGVSEFVPVSSSAHLVLFSKISEFNFSSLEVDVSLHLGSLFAILIYFWKDLKNVFKNRYLLNLIFFGSIPLIIFGFIFFKFGLINIFRDLRIIAWTTLIFGIILFFADKKAENKNLKRDLNLKNITIIGFYQVLALIPGVSRSGIIITISRILNFNRVDAVKISFFLSIPALSGASILSLSNISERDFELGIVVVLCSFFSFIFSFLTIKFLLFYLQKFSLKIFVYYRLFLSFILFIIAYA